MKLTLTLWGREVHTASTDPGLGSGGPMCIENIRKAELSSDIVVHILRSLADRLERETYR